MAMKHLMAMLVLALAAGCVNGPKEPTQKEAATQRWHAARSDVLYGMAKQQYQNGNFAESRKAIDDAIKLNPKHEPLYVLLARLNIEQGQLESAEKALQLARSLDSKDFEVDYLFGVIYERWQKRDVALECYTRASEQAPSELAYLMAKAEMLVAMDRLPEALSLLRDKMAYFEYSAAIRDAVGQMLVQQGKHAEGATILRQASILAPDEPAIREHLALAMFYAGDFREAGSLLSRLVKDDKYNSRADLFIALGECQIQTGRSPEARESFETASQLDPSSAGVWLKLTKAALQLNDLRRADLSARKAMSLDPASSEVHLTLGYVRLRQNRLDDALAAFRKAIALDSNDPVSLCMCGLVLEKQGKHTEAINYYALAIKLKPNDQLAATLMAQARPEE